MQSALPFPPGAPGGLLGPGPRNPSDQSLRTPSARSREIASGQLGKLDKPGAGSQRQTPDQVPPTTATVRPQLPRSQHYLRAQRPTRSLDNYQWSPTRELLSEPQKTLHEVVRAATRLSSRQQSVTEVLRILDRVSSISAQQPSPASSSIAAALQTAGHVAAEQRLPLGIRQQPPQAIDSDSSFVCTQEQPQQQQQAAVVMGFAAGQQQQQQGKVFPAQQERLQQKDGWQDQPPPSSQEAKHLGVQQPQHGATAAQDSGAAATAQ